MKNTNSLKKILFEEIESLINGSSNSNRARSVSKLASQLIYACRVEIENKRQEIKLDNKTGTRLKNIDAISVNVPSLNFGENK